MFKNTGAFASFSVDDLQKAKAFYGQTLGMEVIETPEGLGVKIPGGPAVFIYPKGSHHVPATFTVLNFQVSDIDQTVQELTERGVRFEHYQGEIKTDEKGIFRSHGPKIAWFKDPAGNILSVVEEH